MSPIGEKLVTIPNISPEQQQLIVTRQLEVGKKMDSLAPPVEYMIYPLYYGENDETMTLTLSGVARYEVKGRSIEALVTRDINNTVWLRTFLLDVVDGQETRRKGVVVKVEKEYRKGELRYSHGSPTSYDQHQNALDDIEETLELIASANTAVYGVADFSALTNEELRAIQINAEPGLRDWVDSRFYKDHPKHNPENALKA